MASFIETTGQAGGPLLGGAFVMLVALLLTGSRGGILATAVGLFVLGALTFKRGARRSRWPIEGLVFGTVIIAAVLYFFADAFVATLAERGIGDSDRMAVYSITLRSILDAPLLGFGYGTFADVFPLYRDRSISVQGAWQQAHGTYLEVFQGLGLLFGSMLVASAVLLVLRCIKGAAARQENVTVPRIAASAALLVGVHALVDFSLQIQAVALTVVALLGAGVAQSESSRLALAD
jgi:O-antigen ligase